VHADTEALSWSHLINITDKVGRARDVERLGAHIVGVHSGIDQQRVGKSPLDDLRQVRAAVTMSTSVAGGITLTTIQEIVKMGPDVIVVGGAITSSREPAEVAACLTSLS
jgi:3-keto-L-gulonate-6-phosphate decarboxylase